MKENRERVSILEGQFSIERDRNQKLIHEKEGLQCSFEEASKINRKVIVGLNVQIKSMVDEFLTLHKDVKTQFTEELETFCGGDLRIFSESFFS